VGNTKIVKEFGREIVSRSEIADVSSSFLSGSGGARRHHGRGGGLVIGDTGDGMMGLEINSSIWREEIGNRNRLVNLAGRNRQ
jgi:hypothetical protein